MSDMSDIGKRLVEAVYPSRPRVAISAGHCPEAPGAVGSLWPGGGPVCSEYQLAQYIVDEAFPYPSQAPRDGYEYRVFRRGPDNSVRELCQWINAWRATLAIELHFNAFDETTAGCEVLAWATSTTSTDLARIAADDLSGYLGNPNRGVNLVYLGNRGATYLSSTQCPALILEPAFLDNPRDICRVSVDISGFANILRQTVTALLCYIDA